MLNIENRLQNTITTWSIPKLKFVKSNFRFYEIFCRPIQFWTNHKRYVFPKPFNSSVFNNNFTNVTTKKKEYSQIKTVYNFSICGALGNQSYILSKRCWLKRDTLWYWSTKMSSLHCKFTISRPIQLFYKQNNNVLLSSLFFFYSINLKFFCAGCIQTRFPHKQFDSVIRAYALGNLYCGFVLVAFI